MQITNIEIDNFKSFDKLSIDLQPLTLLIGANGAGKSNFLQVFEFLKEIQRKGLSKALQGFGGVENLKNINTDKRSFRIKTEIAANQLIEQYELPNNDSSCLVVFRSNIVYEIEIQVNHSQDFDVIENITFTQYFAEYDIEEGIATSEIKKISEDYHYGVRNKLGKFEVFSQPKGIVLPIPDLKVEMENPFENRTFIEELNAHYGKKSILEYPGVFIPADLFDFGVYEINPKITKLPFVNGYSLTLEKDGQNLVQMIHNILKSKEEGEQLIATISSILDFIESIDIDKVGKFLYLRVKEMYNKVDIYADLLSDGTMSIIALIVALYYEKQAINFFEEPEHGVHPSLISALVSRFYDVMRYKDKQIIITTHHPEILKNVYFESGLADIYLISRDEDGFSMIEKASEKEMLGKFLKNEMGIDELYINNLLND